MNSLSCRLLLFVLSFAAVAHAADFPGSSAILLGLDSVRSELKVTKAQSASLDQIRANYRAKSRMLVADLPADSSARRVAAEKLKSLTHRADVQAEAVLSASQERRLREIQYQLHKGSALVSPTVQKTLALSDKQIRDIQSIKSQTDASAQSLTALYEKGENSHSERLSLLRQERAVESKRLLAVLTPTQAAAFEELKGKPIPALR